MADSIPSGLVWRRGDRYPGNLRDCEPLELRYTGLGPRRFTRVRDGFVESARHG